MQAVYKEGFWNFLSPPQDPALDFKGPAAGLISFLQKFTNPRSFVSTKNIRKMPWIVHSSTRSRYSCIPNPDIRQ